MGKQAVGAYLRVLREARQMSREILARKLKTNGSQIERIEAGGIDTRGSLLLRLVDVLKGNVEHLKQLFLDEQATADDGRRLAEEWLAGKSTSSTSLDEEIEALARSLAADPQRLGQWLGYGQRLLEEQGQANHPQRPRRVS